MLLEDAQDLGLGRRGSSPTSSRKMVPPDARSNRPGFWRSAPVKAPRSWPKSSLSIRPSGSAPQLTRIEGPCGPIGMAVQGGGDQFLAGAAFADDQHGGIGRGGQADRLEDLAHRGALADQLGLGVDAFVGRVGRVVTRLGTAVP